jgi:hypothetical protein
MFFLDDFLIWGLLSKCLIPYLEAVGDICVSVACGFIVVVIAQMRADRFSCSAHPLRPRLGHPVLDYQAQRIGPQKLFETLLGPPWSTK